MTDNDRKAAAFAVFTSSVAYFLVSFAGNVANPQIPWDSAIALAGAAWLMLMPFMLGFVYCFVRFLSKFDKKG